MTKRPAKLYIRRNGSFGASCDGTADTGHHIVEDSGLFTIWSIHDDDRTICSGVPRAAAVIAVEKDWRRPGGAA